VAEVLAVPDPFSVAELFAVAVLVAVRVFDAVPAFGAVAADAPVLPVVPWPVQPPAAAATPGPVLSPIPRHWHSSWMTPRSGRTAAVRSQHRCRKASPR